MTKLDDPRKQDVNQVFDFQRYLNAKRAIDDRALNRYVWQTLAGRFVQSPSVVEIACGVGTMLDRLAEWGLPLGQGSYLGIDSDPENIAAAAARRNSPGIHFECADFHSRETDGDRDLLIAAAFLDLVDLEPALARMLAWLKPGGLAYFPLNFDGVTLFSPPDDRDDAVLTAYHASMDERPSGGHSRTGRRLFQALPDAGFEILAVGSSDWIVAPGPEGSYPGDEAYFLEHILHFFETSCADVEGLEEWLDVRRRQITTGALVYIAHQLDFLVQRPA